MMKFTVFLATAALVANSAEAIKPPTVYDPMTFAQTSSSSDNSSGSQAEKSGGGGGGGTAANPNEVHELKKKWCRDNIEETFSIKEGPPKAPLEQFTTFVNQICPQLEAEVPMGAVVSQCFHTGYFMLRELHPLAKQAKGANGDQFKTEYNNYITDFCDKYADSMPKRTGFVRAINSIEEAAEFQDACFAQLAEAPQLNVWFDPIDPLSSITQKEICDLHFKLFSSLRKKQRTSLAEYISFSYIASLDLFLNAHMQEDLENCVNAHVAKQPNQWVTAFVQDHPAFQNWEQKQAAEVEASVATAVDTGCQGKKTCAATGACEQCDACSIAISRVYFSYQTYLNNLFAATFKTHSESMFDRLHQANLVLEGAQSS